jgi:hypothetical protein
LVDRKTGVGLYVISGLRREIGGKCAVLGYYAASSGNFLRKFRFLNPEDGTDRLSRNVSKILPLLAAK